MTREEAANLIRRIEPNDRVTINVPNGPRGYLQPQARPEQPHRCPEHGRTSRNPWRRHCREHRQGSRRSTEETGMKIR